MSTSGRPRPGAWLRPAPDASPTAPAAPAAPAVEDDLAARLARLPVGEHAEVLTAEHERLHRLLATVDQL
ncbi:hypothetical protein SAMN05660324_0120 [Klenkia brasiliensis]|uniref:Uncharacterized protein n=1 Tax=Klenkia brasiliensis TaxID=333142 RepID=A0A1G8AFS1_9ACTN|nr:hypothetical protein SAMN05660324_0120 [Klenkia brasiliensis]